jgi:hypothetical protein
LGGTNWSNDVYSKCRTDFLKKGMKILAVGVFIIEKKNSSQLNPVINIMLFAKRKDSV